MSRGGRGIKLFDYDFPVNVQGYEPTFGLKEYRNIRGALYYTHHFIGIQYPLVIHQDLHMTELWHQLLCLMYCQANEVTNNKFPQIYCSKPNQESHAIVTEDEYGYYVIFSFICRWRDLPLAC